MKHLLSKLLLLPLVLSGCVVVAPGPGPGPYHRPAVVAPTATIVFAPGVRPYVYDVVTLSARSYDVRYQPTYVTQVQILSGFRNHCAALGLRPVAGRSRLVAGHDRRNRPARLRVMTVHCR